MKKSVIHLNSIEQADKVLNQSKATDHNLTHFHEDVAATEQASYFGRV